MKRFLRALLDILLFGSALIALVLAATWKRWPPVYRAVAATWAFDKRFPGVESPADLTPSARAGLQAKLLAALDERDPGARERAARGLGRMGGDASSAVPALLRRLDDDAPLVRFAAVDALEGIGELDVPAAVRSARTPDALSWRARKALLHIATPEALKAAERFPDSCPGSLQWSADWCAP